MRLSYPHVLALASKHTRTRIQKALHVRPFIIIIIMIIISSSGHWILQLTKSFQPHYGPGVDSASNRNEYQESSWW
jgi:hypothetical protein